MLNTPYKLSDGLFLEKSRLLLPWFKNFHQITNKGGKLFPEKGVPSQLIWDSEMVFGGINVSIQAMEFGSGMFFLNIKHDKKFGTAKEEYAADLDVLKGKFGKPSKFG